MPFLMRPSHANQIEPSADADVVAAEAAGG
jgi:hypothetical protein